MHFLTNPSVRPGWRWQVGALRKRWEIGLWSYYGEPIWSHQPGYLCDQSPIPCDHPSARGVTTPVKTIIANCGYRFHIKRWFVSYWQPTGTYHRHTQQYHRRLCMAPLSRKGTIKNAEHQPRSGVSLPFCRSCAWMHSIHYIFDVIIPPPHVVVRGWIYRLSLLVDTLMFVCARCTATRQHIAGVWEQSNWRTRFSASSRPLRLRPSYRVCHTAWRRSPCSILCIRRLQPGPLWWLHSTRGVRQSLRWVHLRQTEWYNLASCPCLTCLNPLKPTVAIWVQL